MARERVRIDGLAGCGVSASSILIDVAPKSSWLEGFWHRVQSVIGVLLATLTFILRDAADRD
eukprot:8913319-Pyramimonas_sp.AAC.1